MAPIVAITAARQDGTVNRMLSHQDLGILICALRIYVSHLHRDHERMCAEKEVAPTFCADLHKYIQSVDNLNSTLHDLI